jgi:hypothetical protein
VVFIEPKKVACPEAEAETESKDPSGRSANNQIEVFPDRVVQVALDLGQEGSWEYTLDASSVDRQNAPSLGRQVTDH